MVRDSNLNYRIPFKRVGYLFLIAAFVILAAFCVNSSSSAADDVASLRGLVNQTEDVRIDVNDLAFFLVTHNFDARPEKNYVEVKIDNSVYEVTPNGKYAGLANVTKK